MEAKMKTFKNVLISGIAIWAIPFITGMFFYSRDGQLLVDVFLFKTVMVVLSCLLGCVFLIWFFKRVKTNYLKQGFVVGLSWLAINWLLDFIILIPMSKMSISDYFIQIGLRYLVMPIISISMGYIIQNKEV